MLMLEPRATGWSAGRPFRASDHFLSSVTAAESAASAAAVVHPQTKPAIRHADAEVRTRSSCSTESTGTQAVSQAIKRMPQFFQPLVNNRHSSTGRRSPAPIKKATTAALTEQTGKTKTGGMRLSSAPSTECTTTTETATKTTETSCKDGPDGNAKACHTTEALRKMLPTALPVKRESSAKSPALPSLISASVPLSFKDDGASPLSKLPEEVKSCGSAKHHEQTCYSHPGMQSGDPIAVGAMQVPAVEGPSVEGCTALPYDSAVARLAAALGASSLRLAAAAEEGLESSPSNNGEHCWQLNRRRELRTHENTSGEIVLTESPTSPLTPTCKVHRQRRATAATRGMRLATKPPAISKGVKITQAYGDNHTCHSAPQFRFRTPLQRFTPRAGVRTACCTDTTGHKAPVFNRRPQRSVGSTLWGLPPEESSSVECGSLMQPIIGPLGCRDKWSPEAIANTPGRLSEYKNSRQTNYLRALNKSAENASIALQAFSFHQPIEDECLDPDRPSEQDTGSASQAEGERQFSMILQHSLGLLKREAARCFASSQTSIKQKLWKELQQEQRLRMQIQQEHQLAVAAANAEVASLRARRVDDQTRLEKLLCICCRRKDADESLRLMRTAWRGWQLQMSLKRRRSQLQQVLQQRHVLRLLLHTFSPWRAAATRRILVRQQQRAQRMFQLEIEQLGQVHLEGMQQQQQQLAQLQQQLAGETRLRECLQQSLIGIAAGGAVGAPSQGNPKPGPSLSTPVAAEACTGVVKGKRQQQRRSEKRKSLTVIGMHANPRGRRDAANQRQQQLQATQQPHQHTTVQQLSCWYWFLQNMGLGSMPPPIQAGHPSSWGAPEAAIDVLGRHVKFLDEDSQRQEQQQQQSQLVQLASLLAGPRHFTEVSNSSHLPPVSGLSPACKLHGRGLLSSASAPDVVHLGLLSNGKTAAPESVAAAERHSNAVDLLLSHAGLLRGTRLGEGTRGERSGGKPLCGPPLGLDSQLHKHRRWTLAAPSSPSI